MNFFKFILILLTISFCLAEEVVNNVSEKELIKIINTMQKPKRIPVYVPAKAASKKSKTSKKSVNYNLKLSRTIKPISNPSRKYISLPLIAVNARLIYKIYAVNDSVPAYFELLDDINFGDTLIPKGSIFQGATNKVRIGNNRIGIDFNRLLITEGDKIIEKYSIKAKAIMEDGSVGIIGEEVGFADNNLISVATLGLSDFIADSVSGLFGAKNNKITFTKNGDISVEYNRALVINKDTIIKVLIIDSIKGN